MAIIEKRQFERDADAIERLMCKYTGESAVHFGFIAQVNGQRKFCIGGRVDWGGVFLAEAIANLVKVTPGLDAGYIDSVADVAKSMLQDMEAETVQ